MREWLPISQPSSDNSESCSQSSGTNSSLGVPSPSAASQDIGSPEVTASVTGKTVAGQPRSRRIGRREFRDGCECIVEGDRDDIAVLVAECCVSERDALVSPIASFCSCSAKRSGRTARSLCHVGVME